MSEMEDLKKATQQQDADRRLREIQTYLNDMAQSCNVRMAWSFRCDQLERVVLIAYGIVIILRLLLDIPFEDGRIYTEMMFIVLMVATMRAWNANKRWHVKEGEYVGATNVLRMLGMLPELPERGDRTKQKTFAEGMALVKRWAKEKATELKKGYAPA